jgi:hypothetical protein
MCLVLCCFNVMLLRDRFWDFLKGWNETQTPNSKWCDSLKNSRIPISMSDSNTGASSGA